MLALIVSSPMTVMAAETVRNPEASSNPVEAIAQIPVAGLKIATGAVAIPLLIVGEIGSLSGQAGESLWEVARSPIGKSMQAADTKTATNN
ncbi:MAG: hypothetical protein O7D86_14520 [Proteobacteria bacterium]|nr:hypothetical protein [Pseudomonadota bacterium]